MSSKCIDEVDGLLKRNLSRDCSPELHLKVQYGSESQLATDDGELAHAPRKEIQELGSG